MFRFTEEMGLRLRALRLKEGVTQQELAVLMGRQGKGNHQLIGKVERGKAAYPSLGFIADYLRACRASFADIRDVLDRYTARPSMVGARSIAWIRRWSTVPGSNREGGGRLLGHRMMSGT